MANNPGIPTLAAGAFFGNPRCSITTPSFQFSELKATVPEREVPRHTHETPHFILVTQGVYVTEARKQQGLCSAGTLIFNPKGTTHRDRFRSRQGEFLSISPGLESSQLLEQASSIPLIVSGPGFRMPADPWTGDRILRELRRVAEPCAMVLE